MAWRFHPAIAILVLAALYFGAGKFGLSLAIVNASASPVWPPTGLALAALLLWGNRLWPGVFLGALLVNITTQGSLATNLGVATGNTLEALVAAVLVRRYANGANAFERTPDVFRFVLLAALFSTMISATFGATSLALGSLATWSEYHTIWLTWWMGDVTSNLTVAPLLLVWCKTKLPKLEPQKMAEVAAILGTAILVCVVVFAEIIPFAYLTLLPLAWAAYRFGARTALGVMLLMSGMALYSTLHNEGPFASPDPNHAVLYLQAFLATNTVMVLVLTAAISERKKAEQRLEMQYAVSRVLAEVTTLAEGTPRILKTLCEAAGWDAGVLWKVDRETNQLFCAEVWHDSAVEIPELEADIRQRRFAPGTALPGQVWSSGSPLWIPDIAQHNDFRRAPIALREGLHAAVCFPLKLDREVLGVIECFSRQVLKPDREFLQMLAALGNQTGQFIERQRALEGVREGEARFRQVTEAINEVFWMTDVTKNQMVYISPGYETVWGRTCESLYTEPRNWIEAIHPEDRERVLDAALNKQTLGQYDEVYRIQRPGGSLRWIHDRAFPVRDAAGKVYRIVGIAEDITRQKQVEESLRQSEVRKTAIMETALDGILTIDAAGRVVEFNSAAEKMFGCSRAFIVGQELAAAFVPATMRAWFQRGLARQFVANEGPALGSRMEMKLLRFDGSEFPAEFSLTRFEQDRQPMFTVFLRDVTEEKRAETQIATLAHAARSTAEMICITDMHDRFTFANRAFQEAYGYTEAEILGQSPAMLFSAANPPGLMAGILAQTRNGGWRGEVRDRRKDGTEFPVYLSTSAIKDADGQTIGLMGVGQDITERKQTEERIRLLADAMQSVQEMISITDSENRFTFVNEAFLKAYGYRREEVLMRTPHFLYAPDNPAGLCEEIHQQTLRGGWRGELLNRRKDETIFPVSLSTSEIKGADGKVLGLAGFARDISEQRRMEKQSVAFAALGHRLSAATTPEQAAEIILDISYELFNWEAGYVHLYSETEDKIIPILTVDTIAGERQQISPNTFTLDPSPLMRSVMREGAKLINRTSPAEVSVEFEAFGDGGRRSASLMHVPIQIKSTVLGVLSVQSYRPQAYGEQDLVILGALADYCGEALQRIKAAVALREAEAKYRSIFENVSEGIFRTSPEGHFLSANPAMARMLGFDSPEEMIATVAEAATYAMPSQRDEFMQLLISQGAVLGFEAERVRRDGSRLWVSANGRCVRDDAGQLHYCEGTCQDITERKRVESVLRESEQRFRTLFESAPMAIALHAANGRILETNRAYQLMVGYSAEELRQLGVKQITLPEDVPAGARLFAEMAEGKRDHYRREKRYLSKDGREIWAMAYATALRDETGQLRYIISLVEDITERRRAQAQLRDLAAIVESSSDAILSTTTSGLIASWNQAAESIYGFTSEEVIGQPFTVLVPVERADEMAGVLEDVSQGGRIENFETVLRRKDGTFVEISLTISPVLDGAGKVTGASAIGRDIGARRQLEREILESSANERRRIGHDLHDGLGQILAGIALKTRVLQEALEAEGSAQAGESEQIVKLVNESIRQTRTLARGLDPVDAGANGLPAALQSLAVQTEYLFRVECDYNSSISRVAINAPTGMALYRIAQEAIHNAVSHGEAKQIEILLEEEEDQLSLRIRDDGRGFNPDVRAGLGMGLRIMQYRANSIGGRLTIHSESEEGTEVQCTVSKQLCSAQKLDVILGG